MERTKEEYVALLQETVDFYSEDTNRRSLSNTGSCRYIGMNDTTCAFSRCMIDPSQAEEGENVMQFADVDGVLKPEYQGYSRDFWWRLQRLHDGDYYWDRTAGKGVTESGATYIEDTIKKIDRGEYCESLSKV